MSRMIYYAAMTQVPGGYSVYLMHDRHGGGELLRHFGGEMAKPAAAEYHRTLERVAASLNAAPSWGWGIDGEQPVAYVAHHVIASNHQLIKGYGDDMVVAVFAGGQRALVADCLGRDQARDMVKELNAKLKGAGRMADDAYIDACERMEDERINGSGRLAR